MNILLYKPCLRRPPLKELPELPLVFLLFGPYLVTTINGFEFSLQFLKVRCNLIIANCIVNCL